MTILILHFLMNKFFYSSTKCITIMQSSISAHGVQNVKISYEYWNPHFES